MSPLNLTKQWTRMQADKLCVELEAIAPKFGGHVALTGGCLYKLGARKDCDVLIYRSMDEPPVDWAGFKLACTEQLGIEWLEDHGWCKKAVTKFGRKIDFFDPFADGPYPQGAGLDE